MYNENMNPESDIADKVRNLPRVLGPEAISARQADARNTGQLRENLHELPVYTLKSGSELVDSFTQRVPLQGTWRILEHSPTPFPRAIFDLDPSVEPMRPDDPAFSAYHCESCDGWVHGEPNFAKDQLHSESEMELGQYSCRICNQPLGSGYRLTPLTV